MHSQAAIQSASRLFPFFKAWQISFLFLLFEESHFHVNMLQQLYNFLFSVYFQLFIILPFSFNVSFTFGLLDFFIDARLLSHFSSSLFCSVTCSIYSSYLHCTSIHGSLNSLYLLCSVFKITLSPVNFACERGFFFLLIFIL